MDSTPHFPIYMDYSATNPCDERVVDAMVPWLRQHFGNPASRSHAWGWEAESAVENARGHVAALIGADPREIVWTSGATESNNLALKGAAGFYKTKGRHIITVKTEHKAVLDTCRELERQGFEVSYLDVQSDGLLDLGVFKAAIRPDTILASVMFVNNEIGVVQDIAAIGAICRAAGIVFHVDAAQATGRVEMDLAALPVDLMSLTAHKTYGPKGIAAGTSAACAQVRCQRTRSSAWARLTASPRPRWRRKTYASGACTTECWLACATLSRCSSTDTWSSAFRTTST
jgi:cysteine desulfurase